MTRSSADQARAKRNCFNAHRYEYAGQTLLTCHLCKGVIKPSNESWIADHVVRHSVGGSDDPSNVFPAHKACAAIKDAVDISENAKGKRVSDKHFGIVNKRGWWKPDGYKHKWGR